MAKDKIKKDKLAKQKANCQRVIDHLNAENVKIQAMIDDPNNTDDAELEIALAENQQALVDQAAKLARLTGSTVPPVDA